MRGYHIFVAYYKWKHIYNSNLYKLVKHRPDVKKEKKRKSTKIDKNKVKQIKMPPVYESNIYNRTVHKILYSITLSKPVYDIIISKKRLS